MADVPRSAGEAAVERTGPEPPDQSPGEPMGVLLGAGGDPLILGLPTFIVGSFALAFVDLGVVPQATALGIIIPIIGLTTMIGQYISALWAIFLGQSIVACILGIFGGFWGSLAFLLLGLDHNWFALPATAIVHSAELYFIAWSMLAFFLFLITLRLPVVYSALLLFVVLALICVVLSYEYPGSVTTWDHLSGICVFVFAGLGVVAWLNVGSVALGGPPSPPLGPPLIK